MITKTTCQHCGNPIEFEAEHGGERVGCPHCSQSTLLQLPNREKTIPIEPPKSEIKIKQLNMLGTKIIASLLFVIGGFMIASGALGGLTSKTVFQQGTADAEFYAGFNLLALSMILGGIARLTQAVVNRK